MVLPYGGRVPEIGANNAGNGFLSSLVAANRDGSLLERSEDIIDQAERAVVSGAALLVTGTTVFAVAGGPIFISELLSICQVGGDSTAATLKWTANSTDFTGASSSRANQAVGDAIICNFTATSTAPDLVAAGVGLGSVKTRGIIVPAGTIKTTVGSGPTTTGTYKHYLRFKPLAPGVTVTAAF